MFLDCSITVPEHLISSFSVRIKVERYPDVSVNLLRGMFTRVITSRRHIPRGVSRLTDLPATLHYSAAVVHSEAYSGVNF